MNQLIFILLSIFTLNATAGEVILCKSYDTKNKERNTEIEWCANKDNICILYNHDSNYSKNAVYKLSIAKKVEKYYYARFINKVFKVKKGTNYTFTYSKIEQPGDYIISIIDDKGYILGEQFCIIQ